MFCNLLKLDRSNLQSITSYVKMPYNMSNRIPYNKQNLNPKGNKIKKRLILVKSMMEKNSKLLKWDSSWSQCLAILEYQSLY